MYRLVLRRLAGASVLVAIASLLCFLLIVAAPGNVAVVIGEMRSAAVSRADVEKIEEELGLHDPLLVRYGRWLGASVKGDFGKSLRTEEDVATAILKRLPVTMVLIAGGGIVALTMGLGLGLLGSLWPGSAVDAVTRAAALLGASTPSFFVGALLILLFGAILHLLPTFGFSGSRSWILPSLTIGFVPGAMLSRVARVAFEDVMTRPFVITAISKGFSRRRILVRDAAPNMAPTLLNAFGIKFALMVQAAIVVEPIFSWPGVASYFIEAVRFRDYQVMQACLLLFAVFFISVNLLVDLAVLAVDPKQRAATR